MRTTFAVCFFVFFGVVAKAQSFAPVTPALLDKGKALFEQNCVVCHGDHGHGDGPAAATLNPKPRNFAKDAFKQGTSPKEIFKTITAGLSGTAMASFSSLSEADRWAVANYVSALRNGQSR